MLHIAQPPQYVVHVCHNHKDYEDGEAYVFGTYHERLAGLAACYHLVDEEQYVASVEGGDR